jgi:hypothetical protein
MYCGIYTRKGGENTNSTCSKDDVLVARKKNQRWKHKGKITTAAVHIKKGIKEKKKDSVFRKCPVSS